MDPWDIAWDLLAHVLAPAFGAALAVMVVVRGLGECLAMMVGPARRKEAEASRPRVLGQYFTPMAAGLALVAAILAANSYKNSIDYSPSKERDLNADDWRTALAWSLEPKPLDKEPEPGATPVVPETPPLANAPPARYWLIWLALLAMVVELLVGIPRVPPGLAWPVRALVAVLAGRLLTPQVSDYRSNHPEMPWLLGLTILLEWLVLTELGRRWKDGTAAAALAGCFALTGLLIVDIHYAKGMDIALFFAAGLAAVALVSWLLPGDTGPALAAAAVVLPGILQTSYQDMTPKVPFTYFIVAGMAPLALTPMLLPFLSRLRGFARWVPGILLPLIPAVVALAMAMEIEPLTLEEPGEEDWSFLAVPPAAARLDH